MQHGYSSTARNMLILSSKYPQAPPELISHQLFIVKAAMKFKYPSWLYYDTEYRKWAAATQHHQWCIPSPLPDKVTPCHGARSAKWTVDNTPLTAHAIPSPAKPYQHNGHRSTIGPHDPHHPKHPRPAVVHCINNNQNDSNCTFGPSCRYPHKCVVCGFLGHPATHVLPKQTPLLTAHKLCIALLTLNITSYRL